MASPAIAITAEPGAGMAVCCSGVLECSVVSIAGIGCVPALMPGFEVENCDADASDAVAEAARTIRTLRM